MSVKIKVRNVKSTLKKVETRMKRLVNNEKQLYFTPTKVVVSTIRKSLIKDEKGLNRIFSKNLYNNTRAEILKSEKNDLSLSLRIGIGYFVEYGMNLETGGKPRHVPLGVLIAWINKKFGRPDDAYPRAIGLQKKLGVQGSKAAPILKNTWAEKRDDYILEVLTRVEKVWR